MSVAFTSKLFWNFSMKEIFPPSSFSRKTVVYVNVFSDINQNRTKQDVVRDIFFLFFNSSFHLEAKPISRSKLQSIDIQTFTKPCDSAYTNQDCQVFFGSSAVCRDNQCFCDHRRSYVHNNRCGIISFE